MNLEQKKIKVYLEQLLSLFATLERAEKLVLEQDEIITKLEEENRELKYEYEDSILNRDNPLPYKWKKKNGYFRQYCPKCGMSISNWQSYCSSCGQKIKKCNPLPEMEIKEE